MNENATIAAISTAQGEGGVGVIRISGSDAVKIADRVFKTLTTAGSAVLKAIPPRSVR